MFSLLLIAATVLTPAATPHVHQRVPISGMPGYVAVTLSSPHPALAVLDTRSNTVIWSRSLPGTPTRLASPGPAGLFQALVASGGQEEFLAFTVSNGAVISAIYDQPSGEVTGAEGVSFGPSEVRVANHDQSRGGSVAYRTVEIYKLINGSYWPTRTVEVPDYAGDAYPVPSVLIRTAGGSRYLLRVEIASTEAEREHGLMYIRALDSDSGMLFTWPRASTDPFWMENTYIPLTVAFVNRSGVIIGMDDMAPLTLDFHYATGPYTAAIEVNEGYFASHGITVGDRVMVLANRREPIPPPN